MDDIAFIHYAMHWMCPEVRFIIMSAGINAIRHGMLNIEKT